VYSSVITVNKYGQLPCNIDVYLVEIISRLKDNWRKKDKEKHSWRETFFCLKHKIYPEISL